MSDDAFRSASLSYLTGIGATSSAPAAVGQKFTADGLVMGYAGNTFICHIPPGSAHDALTAAARRLQSGRLATSFAFLPPESYHMTVFEGVTDRDRTAGRWPEGIDTGVSVEVVTEAFLTRVRALNLPAATRIRPTGIFGGFSVRVSGATDNDTDLLWRARAALRDATGIRRPDYASYEFHVTLGYLLRWLSLADAETVMDLSDAVAAELIAAAPEIVLGGIEFCRFADMHAFPRVALLSGPGGGRDGDRDSLRT